MPLRLNQFLCFQKPGVHQDLCDYIQLLCVDSFKIPGANTPCHYDSYGFNLHVQIAGVKRWIIFPPEDHMRPSRFPYEESTIYSRCNVVGGEIPTGSHPRVVDLKPGDVRFLPAKWWHCVIVLEDKKSCAAFSVSRWYPIKADVVEKAI